MQDVMTGEELNQSEQDLLAQFAHDIAEFDACVTCQQVREWTYISCKKKQWAVMSQHSDMALINAVMMIFEHYKDLGIYDDLLKK